MSSRPKYPIHERMEPLVVMSVTQVLDQLSTSATGLSQTEAQTRYEQEGPNQIRLAKTHGVLYRFFKALGAPFNIVLFVVTFITFITDLLVSHQQDYSTIIIITLLVLVSTLISFWQEERSANKVTQLLKMVSNTCALWRDNKRSEQPITLLVRGDVISLSAGDLIPADLRIIEAKDLFVSQSSLSGESRPVEKFSEMHQKSIETLTDYDNIAFLGSTVISGQGKGLVISTGDHTYVGRMNKNLAQPAEKSSFDKGVSAISAMLLKMMLIATPLILVLNLIFKDDWVASLLFSVSLAVGLTPEMLPVVLSSALARGAINMSRHKAIVKGLSSIQIFGEMDVLCTDKTGTLTEDSIIIEKYLDTAGNNSMDVLRYAWLNATFQTGVPNQIDQAILARGQKEAIEDIQKHFKLIDELPFDFSRRRMSVALGKDDGSALLISKGAVEEIMSISTAILNEGQTQPLTDSLKKQAMDVYQAYNDEGLRMIAVAIRHESKHPLTYTIQDETEMVLVGFIGLLDPPKLSTRPTIRSLREHGIRTIVITGDSLGVARKVCEKVGIDVDHALSGAQVEAMDDNTLIEHLKTADLFAKISPDQKQRIVALCRKNHTVGYMGDGVNDALALREADVGISVDSGVEIAKESADIILLQKDLQVLEEAVLEGRRTFGNIIKYLKFAISGNVGNMLSMIMASIFLPFLPMLPLHILIQNLLNDFAQMGLPFDRVDSSFLSRPRRWDVREIMRFTSIFGPLSSLFDVVFFTLLYFVLNLRTDAQALEFQSLWFAFGVLSQILVIYMIRTESLNIFRTRPAMALTLSTTLISILTLLIVFTPFASALDLQQIPLAQAWVLPVVIFAYMVVTLIMKRIYIRRTGHWL